jgi:hypothetical protein
LGASLKAATGQATTIKLQTNREFQMSACSHEKLGEGESGTKKSRNQNIDILKVHGKLEKILQFFSVAA